MHREIGVNGSGVFLIDNLIEPREVEQIEDCIISNKQLINYASPESDGFDTIGISDTNIGYAQKIIQCLESVLLDVHGDVFNKIKLPDIRTSIKIQKTGEEHSVHSDSHDDTWSGESSGNLIKFSAIYCFSSDYSGGEVVFPDENVEIKLNAGQALIFPSVDHRHMVKKVTDGTRYSFLTFWD